MWQTSCILLGLGCRQVHIDNANYFNILWKIQFYVLFSALGKLFLSIQVCVKGYYKSMSRCTKCPTLLWLIAQMVFIVCVIFLLIFILLRDESKTKGQGRTLSDVALARLKIVVGFYQVYFNFLSFSLKWFISLSLTRIILHQNIREVGLVEIVFISFPSRQNYGEIICPSKS